MIVTQLLSNVVLRLRVRGARTKSPWMISNLLCLTLTLINKLSWVSIYLRLWVIDLGQGQSLGYVVMRMMVLIIVYLKKILILILGKHHEDSALQEWCR